MESLWGRDGRRKGKDRSGASSSQKGGHLCRLVEIRDFWQLKLKTFRATFKVRLKSTGTLCNSSWVTHLRQLRWSASSWKRDDVTFRTCLKLSSARSHTFGKSPETLLNKKKGGWKNSKFQKNAVFRVGVSPKTTSLFNFFLRQFQNKFPKWNI